MMISQRGRGDGDLGQCSDPALWEPFKQKAQEIKDSETFSWHFMPKVFEASLS